MSPHIADPYRRGFAFVAAQLGASEFQIGEILQTSARSIRDDNRAIGSVLAFPYHDRRGGAEAPTRTQLLALRTAWEAQHGAIPRPRTTPALQASPAPPMTLQEFRQLVDPWLAYQWTLSGETK